MANLRNLAWLGWIVSLSVAGAAPPTLTNVFPAGGSRGSTVDVQLAGTFDSWPVQLACTSPEVRITAGKIKGTASVSIGKEATPGVVWLRAADATGASGLRPFIIGTIPEVQEKEPNDDAVKAQAIEMPCVVNGKLQKAGDADCFAVTLKKGQMLVASVDSARSLKSPMDAVLQVTSADGFVLEQNNDYRGLDPQIAFQAPSNGRYVVRVFAFPATPDSSIRLAGAETFIYRLTLTAGPFVESAKSLSVNRGEKQKIGLQGINVPPGSDIEVSANPDEDFVPLFHPAWPGVVLARAETGHQFGFEEAPQPRAPYPLPSTIVGWIAKPGQVNAHKFSAKKGQPVLLQLESRSLGFPLAGVLTILAPDGKLLTRVEVPDLLKDVETTLNPLVDGIFTIEVRDQVQAGGPRYQYRLRIVPVVPDYELTLAADRFVIPAGKALDVPVTVTRKVGFAKDIALKVEGLPKGISATVVPPKEKADPKSILLRFTAEKGAESGFFRVHGTITGDATALLRVARGTSTELGEPTRYLWITAAK
jgi:hypothetical protein